MRFAVISDTREWSEPGAQESRTGPIVDSEAVEQERAGARPSSILMNGNCANM